MNWPKITIDKEAMAKYYFLKRYCLAWINLDKEILKEILDWEICFDAPGVPFDIKGIDDVLEAHNVWFKSLMGQHDEIVSPFENEPNSSCYEVLTQFYPYESNRLDPYMQLSFFVLEQYYKIYYFNIYLNDNYSKIRRIETQHIKIKVDSKDYYEEVKKIQKNNAFTLFNKNN